MMTKPSACNDWRYEPTCWDGIVDIVGAFSIEDESLVGTVGEDELRSLVRSGGLVRDGLMSAMGLLFTWLRTRRWGGNRNKQRVQLSVAFGFGLPSSLLC